MRPVPTKTLIARMKREAKARARRDSIPHSTALDQLAKENGYLNWHAVVVATPTLAEFHQADPRLRPLPTSLPIDPVLPKHFDSTSNDVRSKRQLDEWWDRPYALSNTDGSLTLRCLDGGAWDRSTFYGHAENESAALELARSKLDWWRSMRARPVVYADEMPELSLVRMPQRPDWDMEFILRSVSQEEIKAWLVQHGFTTNL